MFILLNEVKRQIPSITAVCSGAIASDYQRLRVESVCSRLGLISLAYLWKRDQSLLLQEMVNNGIVAITVKVAAMGLDPAKHLGKEMVYLMPYLHKLKQLYGINVCGEGGEYETLTLDCPLFKNARIVLDEFQVVLHSSDSIAPVGVLHPLDFHLENKEFVSTSGGGSSDGCTTNDVSLEMDSVCEVQGDCLKRCGAKCESLDSTSVSVEAAEYKFCISRTRGDNVFSICCWLPNSCKTSAAGLQEDLNIVLKKIELQLIDGGFGWKNVLYIHLYIADMNEFALANETYVGFITQEKCLFGVPSRSTIELPLLQVGLGRAYVEVLVASDQSKRVLHVQSISCWAPSCIGPYSQATLHKEILHMAGQLGLDPPTMALCNGGPTAELRQALENSEAVAKCFNCSISTSAILFLIYCSTHVPLSERTKIQEQQDVLLEQMRLLHSDRGSMSKMLIPICLYVLVPDLPKRAFVEAKPILYVEQDMEISSETIEDLPFKAQSYWGFQQAHWHESCFQKCVVHRKICAVCLYISNELALKICSELVAADQKSGYCQNVVTQVQMDRIARFCIYLLDKILTENEFSWEDAMNLRIYFPTTLSMPLEALSSIFADAFREFADMSKKVKFGEDPFFNLVPVLGAGRSSAAMDDIVTCELLAQKV
ncbi:uncharacterized protein LOC131153546 isoform X2 [Malania oleifera]|nr:uncharacterized protein LOC131153546 isoform X2 [Malania oleifera]XP_057961902.1 uncharacterized protein LOC131153546 isoform X2 [Malania oleifera]XP_057961903.1 uncharacterized protein LOC131153546 isoform X2 [Malania oleifera]